jgi:GSH-dependent disulfide-bond oxidoreductase
LRRLRLGYRIHPVNISPGEQFERDFLPFSLNNRMPAIIDTTPDDAGEPVTVFESGAILRYVAEKTGASLPGDLRKREAALEWLFWQMGGLGPMAGQNHHFGIYAPEKIPYAITRYVNETNRLYGVLDPRLANNRYLSGKTYAVADMATYPWIVPWKRQQQNLDDFAHVRWWSDEISARPATIRAYAKGEPYSAQPAVTERAKKLLFGQTAANRPNV